MPGARPKTRCHMVEEAAPEQFNSQLRVLTTLPLTNQAPTDQSTLRLLGCLLERLPWRGFMDSHHLVCLPAGNPCASPLHG